jgi:hypothetical protein
MLTQATALVKGVTLYTHPLDPVDAPTFLWPQPVSLTPIYEIFIEFVDPFSGKPTQGYFSATESYAENHPIGSSITLACENRLADFMGDWRVTDSFLTSHKGDIVQGIRVQ